MLRLKKTSFILEPTFAVGLGLLVGLLEGSERRTPITDFPASAGNFCMCGGYVLVRSGAADDDWRTGLLGGRVPPVTRVVQKFDTALDG